MAEIVFTRRMSKTVSDEDLVRICKELLEEWGEETIGIHDIVQRAAHEGLLDDAKPSSELIELDDYGWEEKFYTLKTLKAALKR